MEQQDDSESSGCGAVSDQARWPLPYLIELTQASPASMIMETLPGGDRVPVDTEGFGKVLVPVGGPTWDLRWDIVDSLAAVVPNPVRIKLRCDNKNPPDFIQQGAVFIVSEKFRSVVEPHVKNTEFLPVHAETTPRMNARAIGGGAVREDLYWMNCWNRCDLIDISRSIYKKVDLEKGNKRYQNSSVIMLDWDLLDIAPPENSGELFGITGVGGGRRFITPDLHNVILGSGLNVKFSPVLLDKRPADDLNISQFQYLQQVRAPISEDVI
jgi:hypothetical protein